MTDILIIEDDPEMGQIIKDFMIKEGFSARLCPTAEEALELHGDKKKGRYPHTNDERHDR